LQVQPKQPSTKGPAQLFTGDVWIDTIAAGHEPSRIRVNFVRFAPSARTAWHSHALGQTLYVTEGAGLIQSRGDDVTEIRPGDIVFTPADEWHWHGAAPDRFMTHISMTEGVGESQKPESEWGDAVTEARSARRNRPARMYADVTEYIPLLLATSVAATRPARMFRARYLDTQSFGA
jgi:quercetin dioxygenase-like cupin family protein